MQQFEVTFSVFRSNEPGRAAIGVSLTSNLKTTIPAATQSQAKAMVESQYGKNCTVYGVRPV